MNHFKAFFFSLLLVLTVTLTGCEIIGDIFKAGMWTALILIVLVVVIVMWIFRKLRGR